MLESPQSDGDWERSHTCGLADRKKWLRAAVAGRVTCRDREGRLFAVRVRNFCATEARRWGGMGIRLTACVLIFG